MRSVFQDVLFALRIFSKSPLFVIVAVVTLAVGIGATTAIFSVADALLLRPLSYRDPDRLVLIWERHFVRDRGRNVIAPANFLDWRAQNTSFEQMAAIAEGRFSVVGAAEPEEVAVKYVSPSLFSMLGAAPVLGRAFLPEEEGPSSARVVMLSHSYWRGSSSKCTMRCRARSSVWLPISRTARSTARSSRQCTTCIRNRPMPS